MSHADDRQSMMTLADYETEASEKSCENYNPYSYVEDMEDPVFFEEEIIIDYEWE